MQTVLGRGLQGLVSCGRDAKKPPDGRAGALACRLNRMSRFPWRASFRTWSGHGRVGAVGERLTRRRPRPHAALHPRSAAASRIGPPARPAAKCAARIDGGSPRGLGVGSAVQGGERDALDPTERARCSARDLALTLRRIGPRGPDRREWLARGSSGRWSDPRSIGLGLGGGRYWGRLQRAMPPAARPQLDRRMPASTRRPAGY